MSDLKICSFKLVIIEKYRDIDSVRVYIYIKMISFETYLLLAL